MTRLIDADALLEAMNNFYTDEYFIGAKAVKNVITNAPTVQRDGWVSVPIEPTEEMIAVAFEHLILCNVENVDGDDIRSAIRYAVQAAPTDKE